MSGIIKPKGRRYISDVLLNFGVHLVYSEGTKTEPSYVKNIKENIASKYNCRPNDIKIIQGNEKSYSTKGLVNYAFQDVEKRIKSGEKINHVWIMFDKDDFNKDDFNIAHDMINEKNNSSNKNDEEYTYDINTGISWHSCWSNECFELWLCLYYSYYNSGNNRIEYIKHLESRKELKKIGFIYNKNINNIHDILVNNGGSLDNAIKYAKKLHKNNNIEAPSTGMYEFAEYFKAYMN